MGNNRKLQNIRKLRNTVRNKIRLNLDRSAKKKLSKVSSLVFGKDLHTVTTPAEPFCQYLDRHTTTFYSQSGEDGVLLYIFEQIGTDTKYCVEFGALDGLTGSNTRFLLNNGWNGSMFERKIIPRPTNYHQEIIPVHMTAENVNDVFSKANVPRNLDLCSIDVDGNDYWIWKALNDSMFHPRVIIIEINSNLYIKDSKAIKYDRDFRRDGSVYYGASPMAMKKLGKTKGYSLVYILGRNAFFILDSLLSEEDKNIPLEKLYTRTTEGKRKDKLKRKWVEV